MFNWFLFRCLIAVKENSAIQPKIELLDKDLGLVDYGTSLTLAAKVVAFPKPDVQWHDADNPNEIFQSEVSKKVKQYFEALDNLHLTVDASA